EPRGEEPLFLRRPDETPEERAASRVAAVQLAVALLVCVIAGIALHGDVWDFALGTVDVLPFALLAFLAYLSQRRLWALFLAFIWQAFVVFLCAVSVLGLRLS